MEIEKEQLELLEENEELGYEGYESVFRRSG